MRVTLNIRVVHVSPGGYELGIPDRETVEIDLDVDAIPSRRDTYYLRDRRLVVEERIWKAGGLVLSCVERVAHVPMLKEGAA